MRRAFDLEHAVVHGLPAPCKRLLQLRLVVDVACQRIVDPPRERLHDRALDLLEAVFEEERGQCGLQQGREDVAVAREALELLRRDVGAALRQVRAEIELARDDCATRPRHDMRADLGQPALGEVGVALVQLPRRCQYQPLPPRQ